MPKAARLNDPASHMMTPIAPGAASTDVNIGGGKAWRALPAGLGAGIEPALDTMKQLIDSPFLDPVTLPAKLINVFGGLMQDAVKAVPLGSPSAPAATSGEFAKLMLTNVQQTATYTAAAAVPGGQPAALAAYTQAMKQAAADFAGAAVQAIAGMTDIHNCPQPAGPIPHGPGVVTKGSKSVFINGLPASRQGDKLFEAAGGSDPIAKGCSSVNIGDDGGGAGGASASENQSAVADEAAILGDRIARAPLTSAAPTERFVRGAAKSTGSPKRGSGGGSKSNPRESARKPAHKVAFRVIDDQSAAPIPGVSLDITLPDGRTLTQATDHDGRIEFNDLESPGACSVTCAIADARLATTYDFVALGAVSPGPADLYDGASPESGAPAEPQQCGNGGIIAEIETHHVQTGETLDSLARQAGLTWQQLALFNWGTANPDDINRHLRDEVGCRKTTRDGQNCVFDSADRPGVVFIPRRWELDGPATDQVHTIRVRSLRFGRRERKLRLFDSLARAMAGAAYAIEIGGGEVSRGLADEQGDILLKQDSSEACTLRWGNPDAGPSTVESTPGDAPDDHAMLVPDTEFEYTREIHLDVDEPAADATQTGDEAARKRLSNMGYSACATLCENVATFQRDTRQAMTGVLADALSALCEQHDDECRPPGARV